MPRALPPQGGIQGFWTQIQQLVTRVVNLETWQRTMSVGSSPWIIPTLLNSWTAVEGGAVYLKDPLGFVHMRGALQTGASGTTAFVLPAGCRPGASTYYTAVGDAGAAGNYVFVDTSGNVVPTLAATTVRLNNVMFLAEN